MKRENNTDSKPSYKEAKMAEDIQKAVEVMRRGGVILYPTDTVWGIGCDATNAEAVKRVYEIKRLSAWLTVMFGCSAMPVTCLMWHGTC